MFEQLFDQTRLFTYFFALIRIGGILFTAPIFSNMAIKPNVKMAFCIVTTAVIYPFLPPVPFTENIPTLLLIINIFKELLIGMAIGTLTSTLFYGVITGGYLIDFQMGFSMVNVMDPDTGSQFSYISQVQNVLLMLIFITIGGPGLIIESVAFSYTVLPIGDFGINSNAFLYAVKLFAYVFIIAVTITAPPVIVLMAVNVLMGILGKLIPQINLMVVGFPIKIAVGMLVFIASLRYFYIVFEVIVNNYFKYIREFMTNFGL